MAYTIATNPLTEAQTVNSVSSSALLSDDLYEKLLNASTEASFRYAGVGSYEATWQTVLSGIDRFGINPTPPNHETTGLIFITRPKLNLSTTSLKQDRLLSTLNTMDPISFPFSIRCYLDSKFARSANVVSLSSNSPFINSDVPFIVPLTNCHQSSGGWPDFFIDTETSQGGFFGEDQTIARGSDFNARSYDISLTFRDIQGGYIRALMYYWVYYIAAQCRGLVMAYPEDIYAQRLNYTCSIYRLVLDGSRRFITGWSKATGCFPKSVPLGDIFNVPMRENYIHAAQEITIPFQANHVSYNDPIVFQEFNTLITRYAGASMLDATSGSDLDAVRKQYRIKSPNDGFSNFKGIPWINTQGSNELEWWAVPEELEDPTDTIMRQIMDQVVATLGGTAAAMTQTLSPSNNTPYTGQIISPSSIPTLANSTTST